MNFSKYKVSMDCMTVVHVESEEIAKSNKYYENLEK